MTNQSNRGREGVSAHPEENTAASEKDSKMYINGFIIWEEVSRHLHKAERGFHISSWAAEYLRCDIHPCTETIPLRRTVVVLLSLTSSILIEDT